MALFGLIGFPLAQSFSAKFFNEKFEREGLTDHVFLNFPIERIDELPALLESHPTLKGLAITIPYKQQVLPYLAAHRIPEGLNACNCMQVRDGKLIGFNTDYIGFEKSFQPLLETHHQKALVLGNGGATEAVVFVLRKLGIDYHIVSRSLHGSSTLTYHDIDAAMMKDYSIIINTTPLGMYPDISSSPSIPYQYITSQHLLYDLVYNPALTAFLAEGEKRGAKIKNGADMLVLQAEENWRIWNEGES